MKKEKKKREMEEYFDIFAPYIEEIEKESKKSEIEEIGIKDILKEIIEIAKKEKKIGFFIIVEIILTVVLFLMIFGILPWF